MLRIKKYLVTIKVPRRPEAVRKNSECSIFSHLLQNSLHVNRKKSHQSFVPFHTYLISSGSSESLLEQFTYKWPTIPELCTLFLIKILLFTFDINYLL